ncbi:MAG: aspartate carbamoyltransferase catalytic subunit [Christensenellales bacterium]|jgi:aspartate carbamoyltransferase catalytic subunit
MALKSKDLLGLKDITNDEINEILNTADLMKHILEQNAKRTPHMQGKSIITLFYENSTRTRMSFELASKYMSAAAANISASASSVAKGETLIDTGRTLDMMGADLIIMRHPMSGAPHLMAKHVKAGVINAGDGTNEHPTQALLDIMTIKQAKGGIAGLKVAVIGDVLHSRVARSNVWGLTKLGAKITLASPATMSARLEADGVTVTADVREAAEGADVIMALRIQKERQKGGFYPTLNEYAEFFGVNDEVRALAKPDAIIMHPGPVNRGVEITGSLADSDESFIQEQVKNGVAIRMALIYLLTRRGSV